MRRWKSNSILKSNIWDACLLDEIVSGEAMALPVINKKEPKIQWSE